MAHFLASLGLRMGSQEALGVVEEVLGLEDEGALEETLLSPVPMASKKRGRPRKELTIEKEAKRRRSLIDLSSSVSSKAIEVQRNIENGMSMRTACRISGLSRRTSVTNTRKMTRAAAPHASVNQRGVF